MRAYLIAAVLTVAVLAPFAFKAVSAVSTIQAAHSARLNY